MDRRIWIGSAILLAIAALEFGLLGAGAVGLTRSHAAPIHPGIVFTPTPALTPTPIPCDGAGSPPCSVSPPPASPPAVDCHPMSPPEPVSQPGTPQPPCIVPYSIELSADPDEIICDGQHQSIVTARFRDRSGNVVPNGLPVSFATFEYPGQLNPYGAFTLNGVAQTAASFGPNPSFPQAWFHVQVYSGRMEASIRVLCTPVLISCPPGGVSSPGATSPPCATPTPFPCAPAGGSPPSVSPPCATPTPIPCAPAGGSPPSVSPPCAPTPTPFPCPPIGVSSPGAISPPCATPTPSSCFVLGATSPPCPSGIRTTQNQYIVDADAGTAGVQPSLTMQLGESKDIAWTIANIVDPWSAQQANMSFDNSILNLVAGPLDQGLGGADLCGGSIDEPGYVYRGCTRISGVTSAAGVTSTMTLKCIAAGTSALHLVSDQQIGVATGTNFAIVGGIGEPQLFDASITCTAAATATPTNTAVPTATPTPVGPRCADFDGNGRVSGVDLARELAALRRHDPDPRFDLNRDGRLDAKDIAALQAQLGKRCSA